VKVASKSQNAKLGSCTQVVLNQRHLACFAGNARIFSFRQLSSDWSVRLL